MTRKILLYSYSICHFERSFVSSVGATKRSRKILTTIWELYYIALMLLSNWTHAVVTSQNNNQNIVSVSANDKIFRRIPHANVCSICPKWQVKCNYNKTLCVHSYSVSNLKHNISILPHRVKMEHIKKTANRSLFLLK